MEKLINLVVNGLPVPSVSTTGLLSAAAVWGNDDVDRISILPNDLLWKIVSRLPAKDAAHTTVLSRSWRDVWHSAKLVLYDEHIPSLTRPQRAKAVADIVISKRKPDQLHLRGQSLRCVVFCLSTVVELVVVDAPLLERLIMRFTWCQGDKGDRMRVKIACAPQLQVLGYLDALQHELPIGNTVIKVLCDVLHVNNHRLYSACGVMFDLSLFIALLHADTKASPSSVVPSVTMLAVRVNLGVLERVQVLFNFLRCFPNVETLHVESVVATAPTGLQHEEFFENLGSIECLQSHIKKVVLHEFRRDPSEISFLRRLSERAQALQTLILMVCDEELALVDGMEDLLSNLAYPRRAGQCCTVLLVESEADSSWNYHRSSDLSVDDPFITQLGKELFRFSQ